MLNFLMIFVAAINVLLGLVVLIKNYKKVINILFSSFVFLISAWTIMIAMMFITKSNIMGNIAFIPASVLPLFFLLFTYYFPKKTFEINKVALFIISIPSLFFCLISPTALIIKDYYFNEGQMIVKYGNFYTPFLIYFFAYASVSLYIIYRKASILTGLHKTQLRLLFFGTLIFTALAIIFNLILPLFIWEGAANYGPIFSIIMIVSTTYAIVKHRLMDIRMVVARSASYSLLVAVLAGFYAGAVMLAQTFIFPEASYSSGQVALQIFLALIMVFTFQPLRLWLNKFTDKIFFKGQYDMNELLDKVAHTVSSSIILIEMMYKTVDTLVKEMKITRGALIVLSGTGSIINSQTVGYKKSPKFEDKDMEVLVKDGILVLDELSESSKYKKVLQKYDSSVCVPIKTENGIEGLMLMGEKQSGDMYSQNDLKIFEIMAPEIAVAVANAKSYEKIEKFNVTLRQEVKRATSELQKKNEQLRELDKAKDEFISMASHQLRTPLTAIKGYLSMLLEGDAGEIKVSQYDFVNEAFQGANRMVGLINDLLNVSRMETGRFFLEPVETDLAKVVEEEVNQVRKQAKEKGLKLEIKIGKNIPKVLVDETKIRQVIMNFVDNAVYYTTNGSVTVGLKAEGENIIYEVIDTGIGVPKEQQKNLFQKFYRADNARHVRPDGTGLGIYLAKRIVDDHGGEIILHSVEGKGSTFGFKIPKNKKLKVKQLSAPEPKTHTIKPEIGELAAGIGITPEMLEVTQAKMGKKRNNPF